LLKVDWFECITGFKESGSVDVYRHLAVEEGFLHSRVNGRRYQVGQLEIVPLAELRKRVSAIQGPTGRLKVRIVSGDVGQLHTLPEYRGALFQVASQFNLLEMTSPVVTPEQGVTRYRHDPTQGPACAIAAGAATIFRNYFVPLPGGQGQTSERQVDCLADVGAALALALGRPIGDLWNMCNGYALCSAQGLQVVGNHLETLDIDARDALKGHLRIGIHQDVEVTRTGAQPGSLVSQVFCSALPVAYCEHPSSAWRSFATLVLEAAYEATVWAAVLNTRRRTSNIALLTCLGGGAFGNEDSWIEAAMLSALEKVRDFDLDIRLVSYYTPPASMMAVQKALS
jgi:hypothetical protein